MKKKRRKTSKQNTNIFRLFFTLEHAEKPRERGRERVYNK
jgi:hypothetical protein